MADSHKSYNWRLLLLLGVLNVVGSIIILPYAQTLGGAGPSASADMSPGVLVVAQIVNGVFVNCPLAALGLFLAGRIGLGAPLLDGWLRGEPVRGRLGRVVLAAVAVGVVGGVIVIVIGAALGPLLQAQLQELGIELPEDIVPPAWQGFLASISAGITEETLLRLFLLTLLAWLGSRIGHAADGRPAVVVLWIANIVSAVLFGALHLPTLATIGIPLTPLFVMQTVGLNALLGMAFGWLYWTYGLESAMLAHFFTDIVLHVIPPLVASLVGTGM